MEKEKKIIVGISIGDLAGIGIEVILKTFHDKRMLDFCTPVLFGSTKVISQHKKVLELNNQLNGISTINQIQHSKINVLNVWKEDVNFWIPQNSLRVVIWTGSTLNRKSTASWEKRWPKR